jgi:hypothetical protein
VFLLAARLLVAARLPRRDVAWKNADILLLRHHLTVVQRQLGERVRPKVSWADRVLIALLLGLIPKTRHHRLRLIVTPGTILRWRRPDRVHPQRDQAPARRPHSLDPTSTRPSLGLVDLATQPPTQRETVPLPGARSLPGMTATNGYRKQGVPRRS